MTAPTPSPVTDEDQLPEIPTDPVHAFAYLVSKCANGLIVELKQDGKTEDQAKLQIVYHFLDFAAGEACRMAIRQGREPDKAKWTKAVDDAFARAVKRTATPPAPQGE